MSKAKVLAHIKPTSFRLHLKDADLTSAEAMSRGKKLGRSAEAQRKVREDAAAQGYEKGHQEGYSRGLELGMLAAADECREHIEEFLAALRRAAERVDAAMENWYRISEDQLSGLGVAIAAQILKKEIAENREFVLPFVREALSEVAIADRVRIRVNPFDAEVVRDHQSELLSLAPSVERVEVIADPSIAGGCLIESDAGAIDATIRTKLNLILDSLREAA